MKECPDSVSVEKCLDVTTSLVLATIPSGKFDVKDGQALADLIDKVFAKVCECASLTSPEYIDKMTRERIRNS